MQHWIRSTHWLIACLPGVATAQFTTSAESTARYQGAPLRSASQVVVDPPIVPGDVAVANVLSDPAMDGFSEARGEARFGIDALGGYARNLARASGYAPRFDPPDDVHSTAEVSAILSYRVTSRTTPVGTPIAVRALLVFTGELGVANYFGHAAPGELMATFAAEYRIDGVTHFSATATMEQRVSHFSGGPVFTVTGPWAASWNGGRADVPGLGEYNAMSLHHVDTVNFNTVMAHDFDVEFTQSATARIPGPWEAFARADFSNTGRFSFEAFDAATGLRIDDAVFTIVPSPAAWMALSAGLIAARRRRER